MNDEQVRIWKESVLGYLKILFRYSAGEKVYEAA
jgi:hypothetical protein